MCIALPRKIIAIVDAARLLIAVSADEGGEPETVSAALVVTQGRPIAQLVGCFVLVHAGFAIAEIDEAEARSRLQVFAALEGGDGAIDLTDFYASATDVPAAPVFDGDSHHADADPKSAP
jgi:hydrogenase expression/formation protein HypC